jgi:hypothetical protein
MKRIVREAFALPSYFSALTAYGGEMPERER